MSANDTNGIHGTNGTYGANNTHDFVLFGGRYSADINIFNRNHKRTLFKRNCKIITHENVKEEEVHQHAS